jgi:outer membrane lipoprotein-sorting protein
MLPILLLAFALPAQAAQAARTADPDWLAPLMARLAAIAQRRADFTEIRHFAALTTDLRSQGWLLYQRPDLLEKMTTAPTREELIVRGDDLRDRAADQAERIVSLSSQPVVAALVDAVRGPLSGDLAGLRGYYQVTASGSAADWHLALLPRAAALRDLLRGIAIDGGGTDITRIAITEAKGDTDIMTITPAP